MRQVEHPDDAAVLEHGSRSTTVGDQAFDSNGVKGVFRGQRRSVAVGGIGYEQGAGRPVQPVVRYESDISPALDHWQHPAR